jgi:hypothetical protein
VRSLHAAQRQRAWRVARLAAHANVRGVSSTRISRRVNAPRAVVYRALLDPRAVAT